MTKSRHNGNEDPDIEEFEALLKIDKDNLDEEIQRQPDFFYRVSMIVALWVSRRDAAKQNVSTVEADVSYDIRRSGKGDKRVTDKEVEELRRRDPSLIKANQELLDINYKLMQWTALKESIIQRGHAMRELVELYVSNYYVSSGVKGSVDARNIDADRARIAMAEARKANLTSSRKAAR